MQPHFLKKTFFATLLEKRFQHTCFPVNVAIMQNNLFYRTPPVALPMQTKRSESTTQHEKFLKEAFLFGTILFIFKGKQFLLH